MCISTPQHAGFIDTMAEGLITNDDESVYQQVVNHQLVWCNANSLQLNISKTREMAVDFHRNRNSVEPLTNKMPIEQVNHHLESIPL